jgi:YebC/PmpR family DNA-binding regulatory protein
MPMFMRSGYGLSGWAGFVYFPRFVKENEDNADPMSGHSKWSTIKRKKALVDANRSKIWTKIIREITIASRDGGGDPAGNPRLALAIDNAKAANMPKDNIERAIKKGTGDGKDGNAYQEIVYEGYGPGGIAYIVEATTDNPTRTVGEVRHLFSKFGGNLGTNGSVAYLFERKGIITLNMAGIDEDTLTLAAIEAGADDIRSEEDVVEVTCAFADLFAVRKSLEDAGFAIASAEPQYVPATTVTATDEALAGNLKLMERLEDLDDVANVFNNLEMDEAAISMAAGL